LGLPVVGHEAQPRALALRLRQYVPDAGGVVLFSSLQEGPEVEGLVAEVGRCLAMQDEKVLILDARLTEVQDPARVAWAAAPAADGSDEDGYLPGLVQYLIFEGQDPLHLARPTRVPGVEYIAAGRPCGTTDVLASQQMRDLFEAVSKKYSLILLVGPPAAQGVETEILAGYANGILIALNRPLEKLAPEVERLLQSLKEANAPLLGCVLFE